jgi:2-dehydro-3-deoxygluconokinase
MRLRDATECRYDALSLGEVMLRFDPGHARVHTARRFDVWEGGGEYNVARGLRRCFGLRTGVVTALADNAVGRLVEDLMLQGGVDLSHVVWRSFDGVGRRVRNGLNFVERGFGVRGASSCSDRGHTAVSQLKASDVDWEQIFFSEGVRWLHTGGIFTALSDSTPEVAAAAMQSARRHGTRVSFDLNYRDSLWRDFGGRARAQAVNRELVQSVDVLFGNEEDFSVALGFEVEGVDEHFSDLDTAAFRRMIERVVGEFPNIQSVATTLRSAHSASHNGWGAVCYHQGEFFEVKQTDIEIFDRVGGGDSFASGYIYGLLANRGPDWALRCGLAHGALAMTTPGDTTMATLSEVERVMAGGNARVQR